MPELVDVDFESIWILCWQTRDKIIEIPLVFLKLELHVFGAIN